MVALTPAAVFPEDPPDPSPLVLLLEDRHDFAERVMSILRAHAPILHADSVEDARSLLAEHRFAAWIFDERLPSGSGLALLRSLRAEGDDTPAALLTGDDRKELAAEAYLARAVYLAKPPPMEALRHFVDSALARFGSAKRKLAAEVARAVAPHGLTRRELDVLVRLVVGQSRAEIMQHLDISESTLRTYTRGLKRKILGSGDLGASDAALRVSISLLLGTELPLPGDE